MANYITRVELHAATYDDYDTLHDEMEQRGFARTIVGDNRVTYHLPTGTYVMGSGSTSRQDALNRAGEAARATGKKSSIIVADWNGATWRGLEVA
jgi:hypothetical protein